MQRHMQAWHLKACTVLSGPEPLGKGKIPVAKMFMAVVS